jgi:cobalt/nickel transport system ATP-binding protein
MIEKLILDLRDRFGISVVIATHDLDLAARIANRVCLVKNGSVFAEGRPDEVFYNPALIEEAGLRLPDTVRTWLEFCEKQGIVSTDRPITREHLVALLHSALP